MRGSIQGLSKPCGSRFASGFRGGFILKGILGWRGPKHPSCDPSSREGFEMGGGFQGLAFRCGFKGGFKGCF